MEGFMETAITWLSQSILALSAVWNWFITPLDFLKDAGFGEIAPWMIFGWTAFLFVFTCSVWHLVNPLS